MGARKPDPQGEHEGHRENHRAGKAGMHRSYLWFLPRAFFSHGGHGCGQHPVFPAPSVFDQGDMSMQNSGATRREATVARPLSCLRCESGLAPSSSRRTPGPIRRGGSGLARSNDEPASNEVLWLWIPAFAGMTRWLLQERAASWRPLRATDAAVFLRCRPGQAVTRKARRGADPGPIRRGGCGLARSNDRTCLKRLPVVMDPGVHRDDTDFVA